MLQISLVIQIVKISSITFRECLNLIGDATTLHSFKLWQFGGSLVCLAYKFCVKAPLVYYFFPLKKFKLPYLPQEMMIINIAK